MIHFDEIAGFLLEPLFNKWFDEARIKNKKLRIILDVIGIVFFLCIIAGIAALIIVNN